VWQSMFEQAGYGVMAPGWPGDQETVELARQNPESVADIGIDDVVEHFASIISNLETSPVLIGHSFGGMIAEKLLGQDRAAAAIAIDAAQIKGVLPLPLSSLRATLPVFRNPANRHRAIMLTAEQFRYSFGNAIADGESADLYEKWQCPRPASRSLRRQQPTSHCTHPRRLTPETWIAGPFCSSWAVKTTPFPKPSPSRR
jgi:pimeloyl-ACP methyl ester carboxylesterase